MSEFYEINPLDTLFFRGSTPMEAGQYNSVSMFPPPVSVIKGSFWTAFCKENNKSFTENLINNEIPFEVTGIFIKKKFKTDKNLKEESKIYVPSPATFYYDSDEKAKNGTDLKDKELCVAKVNSSLKKFKALSSASNNEEKSSDGIVFVSPKKDAKSLANCWISLDFLKNQKNKFEARDVLFASDIYSLENRVGNGLTPDKKAEDGKLYTSTHLRFLEDISIIVGIEKNPNCKIELDFGKGKILLGGEKRISLFEKNSDKRLSDLENLSEKENLLSLVPIEATEDNLKSLISSQKLTVTSGWDLKIGFHKSSKTWIPAGAVFNGELENKKSCITFTNK